MSRPFKPYMGKNTFGVLKEPQNAGEYTQKKEHLIVFVLRMFVFQVEQLPPKVIDFY